MDSSSRPVKLIAHRGWSKPFPENTIPAFAAALAAGGDEIEIDVRVSKDRIPFICHDSTTDRTSDLSGRCDALTLDELRLAGIKALDGTWLTGMGFPTLEEILVLFKNRVWLNIHIKAMGENYEVLELLNTHFPSGIPNINANVTGYADVLEAALRICPQIPRCCLWDHVEPYDPRHLMAQAEQYSCDRILFLASQYSSQDVDTALKAGLLVNIFYADELAEALRLIQSNVTAILTNDVGTLSRALQPTLSPRSAQVRSIR